MNNGNKPAAPFKEGPRNFCGLTKREYMAGLAMQGILANPSLQDNLTNKTTIWVAEQCIELADTLLARLESKDVPEG